MLIKLFLIIFIVIPIIIIIAAVLCNKMSTNEDMSNEDILNQLDIYTSDILDILDGILSNLESIPNIDNIEDFKEYVFNSAAEEAKAFIKLNMKSDGLPDGFIDCLTYDLIKEKISSIITEYKYDSNIKTMYDRYIFLTNGTINSEDISEVNNSENNELLDSVNNFYKDIEGEEL